MGLGVGLLIVKIVKSSVTAYEEDCLLMGLNDINLVN